MENKLLDKPELCYKHIGNKIQANFYIIADNSYYMVITDQIESLRNCNLSRIGVRGKEYPLYIKNEDELFIRGTNKERDLNPVCLDYESFNKVKEKLKVLEETDNTIDIEIDCNLSTLGGNKNLLYFYTHIKNNDDIEEFRKSLEELIDRIKQEIKE